MALRLCFYSEVGTFLWGAMAGECVCIYVVIRLRWLNLIYYLYDAYNFIAAI